MSEDRGSLKKVKRKQGWTWMLRHRVTRASDGRRVENTKVVGLVKDFPGLTLDEAWAELTRKGGVSVNDVGGRRLKFSVLADHYIEHDLNDADEPKAHTYITASKRIINHHLIPRWGRDAAASITTLEIMLWLKSVRNKNGRKPSNPTLDKIRRTMNLIYLHGQRYGLIPNQVNPVTNVKQRTKSDYKPVPVSSEQVREILANLLQPERTLTLLIAATGLRISEACGLHWGDVDYDGECIHVRRTFINGHVGKPKTEASGTTVPLHPLLAESLREWQKETPWNKVGDWIFASERLKGKGPRRANMLVSDYLRPAAALAGVLSFEKDSSGNAVLKAGKIVENDPRRFGFHNLRHGLASLMVTGKITDAKTTQEILRHSDVKTTLSLYTHSSNEQRVEAQGRVLKHFLGESEVIN